MAKASTPKQAAPKRPSRKSAAKQRTAKRTGTGLAPRSPLLAPLLTQLTAIERSGRDGELRFPDGTRLHVSSLDKVYFPEAGVTKGDVMRYYVRVAPAMLPHLDGRPIALKRFPEGITGHSFYQQNVPEHAPDVVRTAAVQTEEEAAALRLVGGDLPTLLYGVQIGGFTPHMWLSRVGSLDHPDFSLIDLDPSDDAPFTRVVELALVIRDVLKDMQLAAAVKTSGSSGIHVCIPLPRTATYAQSAELAERVAERVVRARPDIATVERRIDKRPPGSVYVDVQQNAMGKSVVAPYAVRAKPRASVSCPLRWSEVRATLDLQAYTVRTVPRRLGRVGDLWGEALREGNAARIITAALRGPERDVTPTAASGARRSSIRSRRGRHGAR